MKEVEAEHKLREFSADLYNGRYLVSKAGDVANFIFAHCSADAN
jgi:hypothetical protein